MAEDYEKEVSFIGVSNNDTVEDGEGYAADYDVPYPLAHAPDVWDLYEVPYQPVTIVVSSNGSIAGRFDGPVTGEEVKEVIETLL